ncbi:MAG: FecCD family ABC transporter permease [Pseudonocardiaceae bacterium]
MPLPNPLTTSQTAATDPIEAVDDLDRAGRRRRTLVWVGALCAALVGTVVLAVGLGPVGIAPGTVAQIIGHHVLGFPAEPTWAAADDNIIWLVRLPRVLLGMVVGAALAATGVAIQALVRNVLADPFLLGTASGASTGAAGSILFGLGASLGLAAVSASAFAGALAATALVFATARIGGRMTSIRLVLAGIAVAYALSALTSFLIFASDSREGIRAVIFYLLGSLSQAQWGAIPIPAAVVGVTLLVLLLGGRRLDALAIGDDTALTLGADPTRLRTELFVVTAAAIGAVVAVSGTIGFVGLVVPHVARRMIGSQHRRVLVVAALLGAIFLVWADVVARTAFQPAELPLGIVTALVGTPFLLVLVRRFHLAST